MIERVEDVVEGCLNFAVITRLSKLCLVLIGVNCEVPHFCLCQS